MTAPPGRPPAARAGHGRTRRLMGALAVLRGRIRASELWVAAVAIVVGALSGLLTLAVGAGARGLQAALYGLDLDQRLSAIAALPAARVLVLPVGGLLLGAVTAAWLRRRPKPVVDPVEANALRGGRMSARDSAFVGVQSLISNGFGASVGLEAAYVQLGSGLASLTGGALNLRRSDLRAFVGAGAGAAIAAAFGAPLTGAFYAFEIIIGSYTVANIAPVVARPWPGPWSAASSAPSRWSSTRRSPTASPSPTICCSRSWAWSARGSASR